MLQRCLQLAQLGTTAVFPNPQVGAVIVVDDQIIGEGYHKQSGEAHAEIFAIQSVKTPALFSKATMYVSLEPCSHYGKTPPCSLAIVRHNIPRVVIGCLDPNPKVSGNGIAIMRNQGVEVLLAPDPTPFQSVNRAFFLNQQEKRPLISLKWAESLNGMVAGLDQHGSPTRTAITASRANQQVHQLRANHHAIMVGRNTAAIDDPSLSVRQVVGKSPIRIVLDRSGTLSADLHLFDGSVQTIVLGEERPELVDRVRFWQPSQWENWSAIFKEMYQELGICSILVEGGPHLHQQMIHQQAWDEIHQFVSETPVVPGLPAPTFSHQEIPQPIVSQVGQDRWQHYLRS
ncbi:MAG: bifunctional diaminohydroxyphosphoribosylaminopyrimidine deaminase/5-amino-6-(5-phosphoribosylamino)uracil reductase RibD [Bacteroidota bacterium]